MPRRILRWILRHLFSECSSRYWSMVDLFMRRMRTSWFTSMSTQLYQSELTTSSQSKGQISYAITSRCLFASSFDSSKVCHCRLKQFSFPCNYDTGLFPYCVIVPIFIPLLGSLLSSSRRVLAQVYLSRYPSTVAATIQCGTLLDSP